jgi:hypothetical protein
VASIPEAFTTAGAGAAATATAGTSAAAAEVEGLLDAVMEDLGKLVEVLEQAGSAAAVVEAAAPEEGEQLEVLKTETGVGRFGDTNVFEIKKDRRTGEVREYMNGKPGKVLHDYQGARLAGLLRRLQACV